MPVDVNKFLNRFYEQYAADGDLLRCRKCGNCIVASRMYELFEHKGNCEHAGEHNPWLQLFIILKNVEVPMFEN